MAFQFKLLYAVTWVLSPLPHVSSSGGLLDEERLLYSTGYWHRLQRKRVPFESACYYTHDNALPYGCQYSASQTVQWAERQLPEKEILRAFYGALNGPNWRTADNWLEGDPCWDAWYGITCDEYARVISIDLVDNSLLGTIPASFGGLTSLLKLDLSTSARTFHNHPNLYLNKVKGEIPSLARMTRLEEIAVSNNEITALPPDLFMNGGSLRVICASYNNLTALPRYLDRFVRLHTLELDHNEIAGPIPPDLGFLSAARHIHLDSNLLVGDVPDTLKQLTRILNFDVSHNPALTGWMNEDIIVNWAEAEYLAILNTTIRGYVSSLCKDVPYCWKYMFDTHKDLTWATADDIPDIVNMTMQIALKNPTSYEEKAGGHYGRVVGTASYDENGRLVR